MSQDDKLFRIEGKIDKLNDRLGSIDTTLVKQHESIKYHIKRTDILEEEFKPIKKNMIMVHGALKLIVYISIIATIIEAIRVIKGH